MTTKKIKPAAAERKIKRLQKQLEAHKDAKAALTRQHADYRLHCGKTLSDHLGKLRRAEETLVSNSMTIRELQDQVAMQWQQQAESRSDVERATKLASEAVAKHNRMVTHLREALDDKLDLTKTVSLLRGEAEGLREEIAALERSITNRLAEVLAGCYSRAKETIARQRVRLWNRWLVFRLNKPRVQAMSEAGYIPEKLIKIAQDYWEADKARAQEPLWRRYVENDNRKVVPANTLLGRIRIWLGRA